jgi:hypothetical protein
VTEDDILDFVRNAIGSVWALELLLLLHRSPNQARDDADLIASLRATTRVVAEGLATLCSKGVVVVDEAGRYRYRPASPTLGEAVDALAALYARKPMAVTNAILSSRNDKIRTFADAFRFRT